MKKKRICIYKKSVNEREVNEKLNISTDFGKMVDGCFNETGT